MSHFPYRKRRKNLLTADKTKATKTKSQQLQTTGFGFGSVCLVFFWGRGNGALALYNEPWNTRAIAGGSYGGSAGWCRVVQGGGAQITADRGPGKEPSDVDDSRQLPQLWR